LNLKMTPKTSKEFGAYFYIEFEAEKAEADDVLFARKFMEGRGKIGLFNTFTVMEFIVKQKGFADYNPITDSMFTEALFQMNIIQEAPKKAKS
jgi:hypothetical protein